MNCHSSPLYISDIINYIFSPSNITRGCDYKSIIATCWLWYRVLASADRAHTYMNVLSTLIMRHPNINWRFSDFSNSLIEGVLMRFGVITSTNYRLTAKYIRENYDDLDWNLLSSRLPLDVLMLFEQDIVQSIKYNKTLTLDYIETHYQSLVCIDLLKNPCVGELLDQIDFCEYDINLATPNYRDMMIRGATWIAKQTVDILEYANTIIVDDHHNYPNTYRLIRALSKSGPMFWYNVAKNPNLTRAFIDRYCEKFSKVAIAHNKHITIDKIMNNYDLLDRNDLIHIAKNPNLTREFIEKYMMDIHAIRSHPALDVEWIRALIRDNNITSINDDIINNTNIDLAFIRDFKDHIVNKWKIAINPHVTIEFMEENLDMFVDELYDS